LGLKIQVKTISVEVILKSDLITTEESHSLIERLVLKPQITAVEILGLDLPAKILVEALLQPEFLNESNLRALACDFAGHTLYIFEQYAPGDYRPHECLSSAFLLNTWGIGTWEQLKKTIREAQPAMRQFQGTESIAAFEACRAALLAGNDNAARMAREVAVSAQLAAHRHMWESRKSITEPMTAREKEATWQLAQIIEKL
jgi:hypothetical protein